MLRHTTCLSALLVTMACSDNSLQTFEEPDPPPFVDDERAPDIQVEPATLAFDGVGAGCDGTRTLTVTNVGDLLLTVTGVTLAGSPEFGIDDVSLQLAPQESTTLDVSFAPLAQEAYEAQISVLSNDPDEAEVVVPVDGLAEGGGWMLDQHTQNGEGMVDVLFVIDNSGSMEDHQDKVADNIASFFDWFQTLDLDYHMGVVTTDVVDPDQSGLLQGSPTFITPSTSSAQSALAEAVAVGENDWGDEQGLAAMELALSEPALSGHNAGFLRDGAFLSIILLSDEPEQSGPDAAHYVAFLAGVKPDVSLLSVSVIVGDPGSGCGELCGWDWVDAEPGDKYAAVQQAYPGVFESVCTCDFTEALQDIGWTSAGFRSTFELSQVPPEPSQIEVTVDGSPATGWDYDASINAVVFQEASIPEAFAVVEIGYPLEGGCE